MTYAGPTVGCVTGAIFPVATEVSHAQTSMAITVFKVDTGSPRWSLAMKRQFLVITAIVGAFGVIIPVHAQFDEVAQKLRVLQC